MTDTTNTCGEGAELKPLDELLANARAWFEAMSPDEQAAHLKAQKEGWIKAEMSWGDEGTRVVSPTQQAAKPGEGAKVTWNNDAKNINSRRMYVDGQQWAKVYGWDKASLDARCDALEAALADPRALTAGGE